MNKTLNVATAQYPMKRHKDFRSYCAHVEKWVKAAALEHAELLLFPEYGSIELVSLMEKKIQKNLNLQLLALQEYRNDFLSLYQHLAVQYNVAIVAPSFPWKLTPKKIVNRAYLFFPNGKMDYQEKQTMTRFENEDWKISKGSPEIKIFKFKNVKFGISICYDVEFSDISKVMAQKGALFVLAPSCTETPAGMNRVHVGARARALENQIYVIVSQTVGNVDYSEAVDFNTGVAAVYATCDKGFPDDGEIIKGSLNKSGWIYAHLDFSKIEYVRKQGAVFNYKDMLLKSRR